MTRASRQVLGAIAFVTLIRGIATSQLELTSVESYHWVWAQRPALGYFDHPGMIAWMGAVSTALFGHSPLGVRAVSIAGGAAMIWFVFLAVRRLYDEPTARLAAFLAALVPDFLIFGAYLTPDAPCLLFWSATVWALAHALSGDSPRWWLAAGLFMGLAMDSKYHAAFLGLGVFGFLLFSRDQRHWLSRPEPWLGVAVALVAFSPTIVWNARNGWQSFGYQGVSRFKESGFSPKELWEYPVSQLLLVTPALCVWAWGSGFRTFIRWRDTDWRDRLLAALAVPMLVFFYLVIFIRPVRGHWPVPGYVTALMLSAAVVTKGGVWGRRLHAASLGVLAAAYVAGAALIPVVIPVEQRAGWGFLAREVARRQPDFVVCNDYHLASQMAYLLRPLEAWEMTPLGKPSKNFPNWWRPEKYLGRNALIVVESKKVEAIRPFAAESFERIGPIERVTVPRAETIGRQEKKKEYDLFAAWNYRGPKVVEHRQATSDD
jgi:4-amino-4-deoxy-L-arabinose transferase-like glycosyltransferase